ncbi:hypothetical protein [Lyngbya sp. CCY1209]|jgi:hypothetical protein|uniref:hypothetical protein n=1 Tax=Lyngbya sp. CCY1209 TaxID=2886103 RepID=UPI002D212B89|nr:hypothetical protein [Lyngbya sp. CCY1209]MEB3885098.1 hypothetical protein [Lyngbya sp. CCY1209]
MKTIETIATISPSGEVQLANCENVPVGRFKVVLVIDESPLYEEPEANPPEDSFLAATADLIGSLEGLPSDLSVNKDYLEGLGEA